MNPSDERNGTLVPKRPYQPMLLSLLILVSGILIGAGGTFIAMQKQKPEHPEFGPEYFSERMMRHLINELQLTPEQQEQIEPILVKHFESMNAIRVEARPRIAAEIEQMNAAIAAILTEPQQKIWEDRQRRMREMFREGFGPGRGPGGRRRGPDDEGRRDDDRRGDDRRGDNDRDRDRDGRRPWRGDDPNRPRRDGGDRREFMGPPPMGASPEEPNRPAAF